MTGGRWAWRFVSGRPPNDVLPARALSGRWLGPDNVSLVHPLHVSYSAAGIPACDPVGSGDACWQHVDENYVSGRLMMAKNVS